VHSMLSVSETFKEHNTAVTNSAFICIQAAADRGRRRRMHPSASKRRPAARAGPALGDGNLWLHAHGEPGSALIQHLIGAHVLMWGSGHSLAPCTQH